MYSSTTSEHLHGVIYIRGQDQRSKGHARSTVMSSKVSSQVTTRTPVSSARIKRELHKHTPQYSWFYYWN